MASKKRRRSPRQRSATKGVDGYRYDVFFSYPRVGSIQRWVQDVLKPQLQDYLTDAIGNAEVYLDVEEERPGSLWPSSLSDKHQRSRVILPILCAPYFKSGWCISEWTNAIDRGPGREDVPCVIPIWFNDAEPDYFSFLPSRLQKDIGARTRVDFRSYNTLVKENLPSSAPIANEFRAALREFCEDSLKHSVQGARPWSADWPKLPQAPISGQDPSWRSRL